jgi:hypothetical protein
MLNIVNVPMPNQLRFLYTFLSWYIYRHRPPNKSRDSRTKIAHVTIGLFGGKPARYSPIYFVLLRQVCRLTRKPKFRATPPQIRASENLIYWQVSTTRNIIYDRWSLRFSANFFPIDQFLRRRSSKLEISKHGNEFVWLTFLINH